VEANANDRMHSYIGSRSAAVNGVRRRVFVVQISAILSILFAGRLCSAS
jgi:hypothetical protein